MAGQPKPAFYAVLALVVLGLVAFAVYRSDLLAPKAKNAGGGAVDPKELEAKAEDPKGSPVTPTKEYTFKPAERLPEVKGTSDYKFPDNTVRFAINVWAGWAPIVLANDGFK